MSQPYRSPNWNWLSTRPEKELMDAAPVASRPCLPEVERLDDRILLSAATDVTAGAAVNPATTTTDNPTGALIGLLRGGLTLLKGELDALKLAATGLSGENKATQFFHKLADDVLQADFLKLDEALYKLGADAFGGDASSLKLRQDLLKIDDAFLKINDLLPYISPTVRDALLPAVQKLQSTATDLAKGLAAFDATTLTGKEQDVLQKVSVEFLKIDEAVLLVSSDAPALANFLKLRLADVFLKIDGLVSSLGDSDAGLLLPAVQDVESQTLQLLPAVQTGDGGGSGFTGGLTLSSAPANGDIYSLDL